MDKDFANIEGMFKTNTDIVKKALDEVPPERWFIKPGDDSKSFDVGGRTSGRSSRSRSQVFWARTGKSPGRHCSSEARNWLLTTSIRRSTISERHGKSYRRSYPLL